jgi:hypothetical protein
MRAAPNTSLQRTPAAALPSPLSSQALGVGRARSAPACRSEAEQGSAGSQQAAIARPSRITTPALGPITVFGG